MAGGAESRCARSDGNRMTDYNKRGRVPGPLGFVPGLGGGRVPGPVGRTVWTKGSGAPSPSPAPSKAVIATVMPPPTSDRDSRNVHEVTWPLYASKTPAFREVKQAPGLANCPVAAILAALASTASGRTLIGGMVSESTGAVTTNIAKAGDLADPPASTIVSSSRAYAVRVGGVTVTVSDVLYTDDHDRGWSPFYMRDPQDKCIWAAIIEKGLAAHLGSYENIDAAGLSANDFWEKIVGSKPDGFEVKAETATSKIVEAAKAAVRVPTIGASKADQSPIASISPFHGFAILGMQDAKLKLYDPAKAALVFLTPADFRTAFQAVLFK